MTSEFEQSTVIVDQYHRAAESDESYIDRYKGLAIHTRPGLHDFLAEDAVRPNLAPPATLLDLAAGSGAMALRLKDLGFDVVATDYVAENFRLHGDVPFIRANLNESFAKTFSQRFDGIVASEIVEHLENPRHLARECYRLLKPGGILIVSTPNVDSPQSKALFVRSGTFLWFDEQSYKLEGHISPICQREFRQIFHEVGFHLKTESTFGNAEERIVGSPRLIWLARIISLFSRSKLNGEIYVAVLQKPSEPSDERHRRGES